MLNFLYNTAVGRIMLKPLVSKGFSDCVGRFMDSKASKILIDSFVKKNDIELVMSYHLF